MMVIATTGTTTMAITTTATTTAGITVTAITIATTAIAAMAGTATATTVGATEGTGTMMATGVNFQRGGTDSSTPSAIFLLRLIVEKKLSRLYKKTQFLTGVIRTKLAPQGLYRHNTAEQSRNQSQRPSTQRNRGSREIKGIW
jgi:hypothetical protein